MIAQPTIDAPPEDTDATLMTIHAFNTALNAHDIDAVMALMTDDCLFENTWPPPDGERHEGQAAVRAFWARFFADSPDARFEEEARFAAGDACAVRWVYRWTGDDGASGHVRGVDLFRVRDGRVCEDCLGKLPWRGVVHRCYRGSAAGSAALAASLGLHRRAGTFRHVAAFLAVSEFVRDKHVEAGMDAGRIRVKPNFVAPMPRRAGPGGDFLYLGRLSPEDRKSVV